MLLWNILFMSLGCCTMSVAYITQPLLYETSHYHVPSEVTEITHLIHNLHTVGVVDHMTYHVYTYICIHFRLGYVLIYSFILLSTHFVWLVGVLKMQLKCYPCYNSSLSDSNVLVNMRSVLIHNAFLNTFLWNILTVFLTRLAEATASSQWWLSHLVALHVCVKTTIWYNNLCLKTPHFLLPGVSKFQMRGKNLASFPKYLLYKDVVYSDKEE